MNKFTILCALFLGIFNQTMAQTIQDTISLDAGYANETWYELATGEKTSAPKNEWDIAFSVDGFSSAIHFNNAHGGKIWAYENGTNANWSTIDTTGISTWPQLYNSIETWEKGAFDQNQNPDIEYDYGWGVYNMITHFVTGDSLFIVQLANGDFKKLDIISLTNGTFNFRISDLDNSNEQSKAFVKSNYSGKLMGYYSIQNDEFLDREPALDTWDLIAKQYIAFVPTPYLVSGIMVSPNWTIVKATEVSDPETYIDYTGFTFGENISTIGHDWKTFNMNTFEYDITQDVVYFMQNEAGDIWKIVPKGFGGSATGDCIFTKEQLAFAGNTELEAERFINIYPTPANNQLIVSFDSKSAETVIEIINSLGQKVLSETFASFQGLTQKKLSINDLNPGVYFLTLTQNGVATTKRIVKQ